MPTTGATEDTASAATRLAAASEDALRAALYPNEIIAALREFGLDATDLAMGTGADVRTVRRWLEDDQSSPNRTYEQSLGNLRVVVLYILQRRGLPPDRIAQWLRMPNVELDFEAPLAALAEGRRGEVVVAADAAIAPSPRGELPKPARAGTGEMVSSNTATRDYHTAVN
jgi:hypothetical protein